MMLIKISFVFVFQNTVFQNTVFQNTVLLGLLLKFEYSHIHILIYNHIKQPFLFQIG